MPTGQIACIPISPVQLQFPVQPFWKNRLIFATAHRRIGSYTAAVGPLHNRQLRNGVVASRLVWVRAPQGVADAPPPIFSKSTSTFDSQPHHGATSRPPPPPRPLRVTAFFPPLYSSPAWFCFNSTRHLYNTLQPRGDDWTLSAAYLDVPGAFHTASRSIRATDRLLPHHLP